MGNNLAQTVVAATGLPQDPVEREFNALLEKYGKTIQGIHVKQKLLG